MAIFNPNQFCYDKCREEERTNRKKKQNPNKNHIIFAGSIVLF